MIATTQPPENETMETVFLHHRDRWLRFLRHIGAAEEAEDLIQEAWLKIGAFDGRPPTEPVSYIYRMLHNLMLDHRRGAARAARRDAAWADATGPTDVATSDEPDGERRLIAADELRATHAALDALGEPAASIFRRHRLQDMPQRAIAEELGMGLSTVEKHLRLAYRALIEFRRARDEV